MSQDFSDIEPGFDSDQRERFAEHGFVVARRLLDPEGVAALRALASEQVALRVEPIEYEADVAYPGAPVGRDAPGGDTPRRLLQAYQRHDRLRSWARSAGLLSRIRQLLDDESVWLTQSHHNCVMTKCPPYSSDTGWHQDVRYWSFSTRELINSWLALGPEFPANGGLRVIPGSHRWRGLENTGRLDQHKFLRPDHPHNQAAIAQAVEVELSPGDVLFFHAALFHSASRNHTDDIKYSVVLTYHDSHCQPVANTKSAQYPEVDLSTSD